MIVKHAEIDFRICNEDVILKKSTERRRTVLLPSFEIVVGMKLPKDILKRYTWLLNLAVLLFTWNLVIFVASIV